MKLIETTCKNCGAKMKIDTEKNVATCEFCGSEMIIEKENTTESMQQSGYEFEKGRQKAKKENKSKAKASKTRLIAGCGMLTAAAVALQYIEIAIPIIPSFIKLDFSDLPALIGAFAYGPIAGVLIELLKNLIHMAVSQSGFVGELSNFILGAVFTCVAGSIYAHKKTRATAVIGGFVGALAMAIVSVPCNYFVIYPLYYSVLGFPEVAVLGMYQALLPSVKNILQALLIFNVPFTFVKGAICMILSGLIYKPLSPLLKGKTQQ